jgi:hypothetical protein
MSVGKGRKKNVKTDFKKIPCFMEQRRGLNKAGA